MLNPYALNISDGRGCVQENWEQVNKQKFKAPC